MYFLNLGVEGLNIKFNNRRHRWFDSKRFLHFGIGAICCSGEKIPVAIQSFGIYILINADS